jgi:hypothetical protein
MKNRIIQSPFPKNPMEETIIEIIKKVLKW